MLGCGEAVGEVCYQLFDVSECTRQPAVLWQFFACFCLEPNLDLVEFVADCDCVEFGVYVAQ